MRAAKLIRRFVRNQRGHALAMGATALPMLLAAAGYGVDTMQIASLKRQMQRAADSAAIAGAYALAQELSPDGAVSRDLGRNRHPTLASPELVTTGPAGGFAQTVRVQLTARPRLAFVSIFSKSGTLLTGDATAALVSEGRFCMLSLYGGTDAGVTVGGNSQVDLGCGIATNARGNDSISAGGTSLVRASPLMAVGGINGNPTNFAGTVKIQPYGAEQKDPFAGVANPPVQTCTARLSVQPNAVAAIQPGCYAGMDLKGTATLAPGTYFINGGDLEFGSQSKVTGSGVTFVMTGPGGAAGDLKMNAGAVLDLHAPTSGEYDGLLFYRDRRAANIEIKINGGASAKLSGAFYFPSSDVTFTGDAGFQVRCFQLVGQMIKLNGGSDISNQCPATGNRRDFALQFVRLIA